jgi:tetratricopeptide (TPR) repeat protein
VRACVVIALALAFASAARADTKPTDGLVLVERLGATSRADVERAVADIERAPATTPYLDEAMREAARACEDVLADPARALALYDRILAEFPNGSASRVARVRARLLRDRVGTGNVHAKEAAALAALVTSADDTPVDEVIRRAEALAALDWPGAPDAAFFLAEWLQRTGRLDAAQRRYLAIETRWPGTPQALAARRGGASVAIMAHAWSRAEELARALPVADEADRVLKEELLQRIERGRRLDFWYWVSWILLVGCLLGLFASLADAALRGGWRRPSLKPPVEVLFLLPISAVLVGVALTTHVAIAPAVFALTAGGLVLAWISGITLELLRAHRRAIGMRAAINVALCLVSVIALVYIVLTHDDLLDMMIETIQFGPDP